MHSRNLHPSGLLTLAALLLSTTAFAADIKDECVDANANAQRFQREGKFGAAREQLQICVGERCPGMVRDDCALRLDELEHLQPTIVFDVKDAAGNDLSAVRVSADNRLLTDRLDGSSLRVDPGEHTFLFETSDRPPLVRRFLLREGEKARRERIVIGATPVVQERSPAPAGSDWMTQQPRQQPGGSARKTIALAIGGLGVAGIAVGSVFGLLTISNWNSSKSECSQTSCPQPNRAVSDHDSAITDGTISTIGFVAGAALVGVGLGLWLTAPSGVGAPASTAQVLRILSSVRVGIATVDVKGEF